MTNNKYVLDWINEMADLVKPGNIVWIDGSKEQIEALRKEACETGEMIKLNQDLLPGCHLHQNGCDDVARVEDRTFICTRKKEDAGNINNWMEPVECYSNLKNSITALTKAKRCTSFPIPWVWWVQNLQKLVSS